MDALTIATFVLAGATSVMAWQTYRLAKDSREGSKKQIETWVRCTAEQIQTWEKNSLDQIGIQTWLELEGRFDSRDMMLARRNTASAMQTYHQTFKEIYNHPTHLRVPEQVPEFFESIGTVYNLGFINKQLADSSFSYYAVGWWHASKSYIENERKRLGDDNTLFYEFEKMTTAMRHGEKMPTQAEITSFLTDERALSIP